MFVGLFCTLVLCHLNSDFVLTLVCTSNDSMPEKLHQAAAGAKTAVSMETVDDQRGHSTD